MPNSIRVTNPENNRFWEKVLSEEEFSQVKEYCQKDCTINFFSATFKPVRTHNCNDFFKDFFLPTVLNQATRVQDAVGRIFALIGALILDLFTLPIRLITCIPRILTNSPNTAHPFYKYLESNGVDRTIFNLGHVRVKAEMEREKPIGQQEGRNGVIYEKYAVTAYKFERDVHFVECPEYDESYHTTSMGTTRYRRLEPQ